MNKSIPRLVALFSIAALITAVCFTAGCARKKPCKAIVTVIDDQNFSMPVSGVIVRLKAGNVDLESTTDVSGKAEFETELPKILDIYIDTSLYTMAPEITTGAVVKFEEGKTQQVTVDINP